MPFKKIDLHSHFVPPGYAKALEEAGITNPDGMPGRPDWSEEDHLHFHDTCDVTKSVLTISSPGVSLHADNPQKARDLARYVNEFAADMKKRSPAKFGFFASLPVPDVEGCLAEIAYAGDHLNCDGYVMMTNHHGYYPGDPALDPIFDELNRRKAILFIHPTTACVKDVGPAIPLKQYPRPIFEFFFDSARAYINLFLSGTVSRCKDITFVVTHMAGVIPPLIDRFSSIPGLLNLPGVDMSVTPASVRAALNSEQFFFDTAGWVFPDMVKGMLTYLEKPGHVQRIVYGSDFPWTKLPGVQKLSEDHEKYLEETFGGTEGAEMVARGNAVRLLEWKGKPAASKV